MPPNKKQGKKRPAWYEIDERAAKLQRLIYEVAGVPPEQWAWNKIRKVPRRLTLREKVDVIHRLCGDPSSESSGVTQKQIAAELGVNASAISSIMKNRERYVFLANNYPELLDRKHIRTGKLQEEQQEEEEGEQEEENQGQQEEEEEDEEKQAQQEEEQSDHWQRVQEEQAGQPEPASCCCCDPHTRLQC